MSSELPAIGTFIRPVGSYGYCLEAAKLTIYDNGPQITYRRYGMRDGQPFDDGHCSLGHYLNDLVPACKGAWKQPASGYCETVYWRTIKKAQPAIGQQILL